MTEAELMEPLVNEVATDVLRLVVVEILRVHPDALRARVRIPDRVRRFVVEFDFQIHRIVLRRLKFLSALKNLGVDLRVRESTVINEGLLTVVRMIEDSGTELLRSDDFSHELHSGVDLRFLRRGHTDVLDIKSERESFSW